MSETYTFIDGAYFRQVTSQLIQKKFDADAGIDYPSLCNCFWQRNAFDLIQSTKGFYVRLGKLSGKGNKKRQGRWISCLP